MKKNQMLKISYCCPFKTVVEVFLSPGMACKHAQNVCMSVPLKGVGLRARGERHRPHQRHHHPREGCHPPHHQRGHDTGKQYLLKGRKQEIL